MIVFNELTITPDGSKLIIDVSVKDLEYYTDVYLDQILIDSQDTFIESGPSSQIIYSKTISENVKSFRVEIDNNSLLSTVKSNLFFVYIKTKGTPSSDTPCGMDNNITLGITTYYYPLYQKAISYMKQLDNTCDIPKDFINFILQYKAFQLSIKAGHYVESIKIWNKLYDSINKISITSKCKCHG